MLDFKRTQMKFYSQHNSTTKGSKMGYVAFIGETRKTQICITPIAREKKTAYRIESHEHVSEAYWEGKTLIKDVWNTKILEGIYKTSKEAIAEANRLFEMEG